METKKINLNELFKSKNPQDGELPQWARELCMEFGEQLLDVAVNNANLAGVPMNNDRLSTEYEEKICVFNDNTDDYMYGVNAQSILDTIKQVE
jgi:hypothetical protein